MKRAIAIALLLPALVISARSIPVLFAIKASVVAAQSTTEHGRFYRCRGDQGRSSRGFPCGGQSLATYEIAPANGAGMGTACAGTTPTSAQGTPLTFSRASNATCLRSGTTTGIANGDLVKLTTGQPRVMPGGDGSGGLGILIEGPRTNDALRSEEFENVVWLDSVSVSAAPTRTANFAVSPDGAANADRLQFPAATATGNYSSVFQSHTGVVRSGSVFVKGNGTSGNICIVIDTAAGTSCSFNAATWTRCLSENKIGSNFFIGNFSGFGCNAGGNQPAIDVLIYGGQDEVGPFASSYIPTVGTAATRVIDIASLSIPSTTIRSIAVTRAGQSQANSQVYAFLSADDFQPAGSTGTPGLLIFNQAATASVFSMPGVNVLGSGAKSASLGARSWAAVGPDGAAFLSGQIDGTLVSPPSTSVANVRASTWINIGDYNGTSSSFSVMKQICADPGFTTCR